MATEKTNGNGGSKQQRPKLHWAATPEGKARLRKKAQERWSKIRAGEMPAPRQPRPSVVPVIREGNAIYRIAVMGLTLEEVAKVAAVVGNTHAITLESLGA